jgi:WD repeat-containing protein 55
LFAFCRRNFNPNGRDGIIDYSDEEFDEVEDILLTLGDISENIGNFIDNQRFMITNEEDGSSSSDEDFYGDENERDSDVSVDSSGSQTDESEREAMEAEASENRASGDQPSTSGGEKRLIVDFDENDEEDEVVRKIIAEKKKPRSKPPNITTEDFPTDLSFSPDQNILAIATVTGDVLVYKYTNEENTLVQTHEVHKKSIRDIEFSTDGRNIISGSRDKSIIITDFETGKFKRFWDNAHSEPIYTLTVLDENLIASGDDDGTVRLWDIRERGSEPVFSLKEVEDYISCIITNNQKK